MFEYEVIMELAEYVADFSVGHKARLIKKKFVSIVNADDEGEAGDAGIIKYTKMVGSNAAEPKVISITKIS